MISDSSTTRRLPVCATLATLSLSLSLSLVSSLPAQHKHAEARVVEGTGGAILPPGTIDGSVTADLIPDDTAYRIFLSAASRQPMSPIDELSRQRAMLSRARLSENDFGEFAAIVADFQAKMEALDHSSHSPAIDPAVSHNSILMAARNQLATRLSAEGLSNLHRLIQVEKRRMKIVPFPAMK